MSSEVRLRNLQLEAVWLLLRGNWTVSEMMAKIGLSERNSICMALRRLRHYGVADVVEKRGRSPVWGIVRPEA